MTMTTSAIIFGLVQVIGARERITLSSSKQ